jgi:hypothetical protein
MSSRIPASRFLAVAALFLMAACGEAERAITAPGDNLRPLASLSALDDPTLPQISAGANHVCGITTDHRMVCWGNDGYERIIITPPPGQYLQVEAGQETSCALRIDREVVCWGREEFLPGPPPPGPFARISFHGNSACGIRPDGTLVCWNNWRYDISQVPAGTFQRVTVGAGGSKPCALQTDGLIVCWRNSAWNPLQLPGTYLDVLSFGQTVCGVKPDHTVVCNALDIVPAESFMQIDARGSFHGLGLRPDGTLAQWGSNGPGDVPPGENHSFVAVSSYDFVGCGLRSDGRALCWGEVPGSVSLIATAVGGPYFGAEASPIQFAAASGYSTYQWDFGDGTSGAGASPSHAYADVGEFSVTVTLGGGAGTTSASTTVHVTNLIPEVTNFQVPTTVTAGVPYSVVVSFSDPGVHDGPWKMVVSNCDGEQWEDFVSSFATPLSIPLTNLWAQSDCHVEVKIADRHAGWSLTGDAVISQVVAPNTEAGSNVSVTPSDPSTGQPSTATLSFATITQPGLTTVTQGTLGTAESPPPPANFRLGSTATYYDIETNATFEGAITVCLDYSSVSYGNEGVLALLHYDAGSESWHDVTTSINSTTKVICGSSTSLSPFLVAEANLAPVVTRIALPTQPIPLGQSAAISGSFTDGNPRDAHTASLDWDDGLGSTPGAIVERLGSVSGERTYATAGVYTLSVTVSDGTLSGDRNSIKDIPGYIVVYDPAAGFVTGGGWIDSPVNACHWIGCDADGNTAGKATFGFVSRYQRGANAPTGNTAFQFATGGLSFNSTSYQWLVVADTKAQFKGEGTINGGGSYGFLLTAIDGGLVAGGGADRFRIKIWNKATGTVVYDNKLGSLEDSSDATSLSGGAIVIHK